MTDNMATVLGTSGGGFDTEAQLVELLRAGDDAAFEAVVRQYSGRLLAAARRLLRNEDDAADAVQEAFLAAYKSIEGFQGAARLSTWLHRIVINAALMKLRGDSRRPEDALADLLPRFNADGEWMDTVRGWDSSSEELLGRRETRVLVRRCIDRLPDAYRTVLMLRDIEDLDTEEVAEMLGVTANAVKIRLHRARQALRTLLESELRAADSHGGRVPAQSHGTVQMTA
jgi:RNA polymerase sigma-70 factor (ECF subfamily)